MTELQRLEIRVSEDDVLFQKINDVLDAYYSSNFSDFRSITAVEAIMYIAGRRTRPAIDQVL